MLVMSYDSVYHVTDESYEDHTRKFWDESINRRMIALSDVITTFVLATGSVGYGFLASTKELAKFSISSDKVICFLGSMISIITFQFPGGNY